MKAKLAALMLGLCPLAICHGYTLTIISSTPAELRFSASYPVYGDLFGFVLDAPISGGTLSASFHEMGTTLGGYIDILIESTTLSSHGWIYVDPTGGDGSYSTFAGYSNISGIVPTITETHEIYPNSPSIYTWTFSYLSSSDSTGVPDGGSTLALSSLVLVSLGLARVMRRFVPDRDRRGTPTAS